MRVLVWATTLQADVLALALHLDARADTQLLVVAKGVEALRHEPITRVRPLRAPILARDDPSTGARVRDFRPDVAVFDNHLPPDPFAPRLCSMWHGLGWKARPVRDLKDFYRGVARLTGADPREPNPRFMAQCYGEPDRKWRIEQWGLDPDACRVTGMAYTDLLLAPPYDRAALADHYPGLDIGGRPTVLMSFTWHYGRIFPGTWRPGLLRRGDSSADLAFLRDVVALVHDEGGQVLLCLHDRHRYEAGYLDAIHRLASGWDRVHIKHKSDHPDNLADLVVADAMLTNLSSFVTCFYVFGRPSVHIVPATDEQVRFAQLRRRGVKARSEDGSTHRWMNAPEDNGGLTASTADGVLDAMRRAMHEPECCRERSETWLREHVDGIDGRSAARFGDALARFSEA